MLLDNGAGALCVPSVCSAVLWLLLPRHECYPTPSTPVARGAAQCVGRTEGAAERHLVVNHHERLARRQEALAHRLLRILHSTSSQQRIGTAHVPRTCRAPPGEEAWRGEAVVCLEAKQSDQPEGAAVCKAKMGRVGKGTQGIRVLRGLHSRALRWTCKAQLNASSFIALHIVRLPSV